MSEQLKESLSAAVDDAADEFELRRVLDETGRNDALHGTFGRYQLVKSVLRGETSTQTLRDRHELQQRIRASFEEETPADQQEETAAEPDKAPAAASQRSVRLGIAAAAAIAVLTALVVGFTPTTTDDVPLIAAQPGAPLDTTVVSADPVSRPDGAARDSAERVETIPDGVVDRHRQYLERHRSGDIVDEASP